MNIDQTKPMNESQLEYVNEKIKKIYFYLISFTAYDPEVIEVMKLAALANVQRRYEAGETW